MKKTLFVCAAAALLCACAGNIKNMNTVNDSVWMQDPVAMCNSLIEQNAAAMSKIRAAYSQDVAEQAASLYQELDLQSNAVCRSRITQRAQIERIKELRAEYIGKIDLLLSQSK